MKKIFSILFTLVLVLSLSLVTATPVLGSLAGTLELGTQGDGEAEWSSSAYNSPDTSAKLTLPAGFTTSDFGHAGLYPSSATTLNDITDVSYYYYPAAYTVSATDMKGGDTPGTAYPASYVVFDLDTDGDSTADVWVVQYEAFDIEISWQKDTISDSVGTFHVEGYTNAYNQSNHGTLAQVKAIDDDPAGTVGTLGAATVVRVGLETGGWTASGSYTSNALVTYVDDLTVNGTLYDFEAGGSVGLSAEVPSITAISVSPTSIDFGTIYPGNSASGPPIVVMNVGTVQVDVDADLDPLTGSVFNYLELNGAYSTGYSGSWPDKITDLDPTEDSTLTTQLVVPPTYSAGPVPEEATLVFEATASSP